MALVEKINQPTWCCNDDGDAALESCDLSGVGKSTSNDLRSEIDATSQWPHNIIDLHSKFAGRRKNESKRTVWLCLAAGETRHHRKTKSEGLTRAGLSATKDIASIDGIGQGCYLDRKWGGLTFCS